MSADHLTGLLAERSKAHGDFRVQFAISQDLKQAAFKHEHCNLSQTQREALEMILVKVSRILAGHSGTVDHWDDIAGYATLIANSLRPAPTAQVDALITDYHGFKPQPTGPRHCIESGRTDRT